MNLLKKYSVLVLMLLLSISAFSQAADASENNFMYENGKIYVVVAVVVVIVVGLFIYLFNLDRKITKLEKKE